MVDIMSDKKLFGTFTKLCIAAVGSTHLINKLIDSSVETNKKILHTSTGHYYKWSYGKVYYTVTGNGTEPLMLIHDTAVDSCASEWDKLLPYLTEQFKIYTIDLPGCGRSDKPALTYTNYLYVSFLQSFIQDVIKEDVTIAATALSSSFVFTAAAFDHSRIKQIYAINPRSLNELASSVKSTGRLLRAYLSLPVLGTCSYHIVTGRRNIEFNYTEKMYYNPFQLSKVRVEKSYVAAHLGAGKGRFLLSSLKGGYMNWDIRHILSKLDIPVTLITGEKLINEGKIAQAYRKLNDTFIIETVPESKALPQEENPSFTASVITAGK